MRSDFDALLKVNQLKRLRAEARLAVLLTRQREYLRAGEKDKAQLERARRQRGAAQRYSNVGGEVSREVCLAEEVYVKWARVLMAKLAKTARKIAEMEPEISAARAALGQVIASETALSEQRNAASLVLRLEREITDDEMIRALFSQI